jgi:Tol biopolymer transport system component
MLLRQRPVKSAPGGLPSPPCVPHTPGDATDRVALQPEQPPKIDRRPMMTSLTAFRQAALIPFLVAPAACASRPTGAGPAPIPVGADETVFAPGVVSTGDVFASTFTPDGRTVYFTRVRPDAPFAIMRSSLNGGTWSAPAIVPFSGQYRDLDPALSPDGRRLYFSSYRPTGATPADTATRADTWYVDRDGDGWGAPRRIAEPVNSAAIDMYPSPTRAGALYFDSFRSAGGQRLVYRAASDGRGGWSTPELLPPTINADSGASNLYVDPDERYVIFATRKPDGFGGADLYISWRDGTAWTAPLNLGPRVNTENVEFCPSVSNGGRVLYFTRAIPAGGPPRERNIHMIRLDLLVDHDRRSLR